MNFGPRAWRTKLCVLAWGALQSINFACRTDNPGFFTDKEETSQGKDSGGGSGDTNSFVGSGASEGSRPAGGGGPTKAVDDTESSATTAGGGAGSGSSTTSAGPPPGVDEPCRRGAALCYDFRNRVAGLAPNLSGINPENKLVVTDPAEGFSTDSPVLGSRIRMTEASSVVSSQPIPFDRDGAIGVDIWFATKFDSASSMMLLILGDLLTLEIRSNAQTVCKLFPKAGDPPISLIASPRNLSSWSHSSCLIRTEADVGSRENSGDLVASARDGFTRFAVPANTVQARPTILKIGTGASPLPGDSGIASFQGDLYLVRVWSDAETMQKQIRAELKHFGLDPAN